MAINGVAEFVREQGGELGLVLHARQHRGVDIDDSIREREGIHVDVGEDAYRRRHADSAEVFADDADRHLLEVDRQVRVLIEQSAAIERVLDLDGFRPEELLLLGKRPPVGFVSEGRDVSRLAAGCDPEQAEHRDDSQTTRDRAARIARAHPLIHRRSLSGPG
jgi:hypothetical protein